MVDGAQRVHRAADGVVVGLLGDVLHERDRGASRASRGSSRPCGPAGWSPPRRWRDSSAAIARVRVARCRSSQSRNGSFDDWTMIGPSVSALKRAAAALSSVRVAQRDDQPAVVRRPLERRAGRDRRLARHLGQRLPLRVPDVQRRRRAARRREDREPLAVVRPRRLAHLDQPAQRRLDRAGLRVDDLQRHAGRRQIRRVAVAAVVDLGVVVSAAARSTATRRPSSLRSSTDAVATLSMSSAVKPRGAAPGESRCGRPEWRRESEGHGGAAGDDGDGEQGAVLSHDGPRISARDPVCHRFAPCPA